MICLVFFVFGFGFGFALSIQDAGNFINKNSNKSPPKGRVSPPPEGETVLGASGGVVTRGPAWGAHWFPPAEQRDFH